MAMLGSVYRGELSKSNLGKKLIMTGVQRETDERPFSKKREME